MSGRSTRRRRVSRWRRLGLSGWRGTAGRAVAVAMTVVLPVTLLQAPALAAPPAQARTLSAQEVADTHGTRVRPLPRPDDLSQRAGAGPAEPVVWPAGTGEADLRARSGLDAWRDRGLTAPAPVRAGTLPVWVAPAAGTAADPPGAVPAAGPFPMAPARVRVSVRDRADVPAGWRNGVVLEVIGAGGPPGADTAAASTSATGRVSIQVDYRQFASAFGGDWAGRLRLSLLPRCALADPGSQACRAAPLASRNDAASGRVSADVPLAGGSALVALTAGPSGGAGDFTASSLQASSTWSAGGNSGSFSWSYPLPAPPSLGGPAPEISLAYSSAAVDGRSEATNNQPSWVGEGFDWWPGYIERRYKPCADDMAGSANNGTKTGDQCWGTDNATLSLNGSGGELIRDGSTGAWRLESDDASRVERLTNTVNGDDNNEYWKVTTSDGTQYFFGRNRLPGHTGTAPADKATNSTWTLPVAGNHTGEPCRAASFVASFCTQAWRWNLDYVVDPHGNTMSLFYGTETNRYGRNNTPGDAVSYVRGGWLDRIEYGTDNRSGTDTVNSSTPAPMRVTFGRADRCLSSCATHDEAHWPDTPWDQSCTGSACADRLSPTFWTTKRLSSVTTRVWDAAAGDYKDVDTWTLTHNFPDPGDGTRAGMWLESIVHTGRATGPAVIGGAIALPEVNFDWVQMPNRVDTVTDGEFPMNWMRLSTIWTDTGGKIDVRYSGPQCVAGTTMPSAPQSNTLRCYPVLRKEFDGSIDTDYFHKYVVTSVTEADRTGGSPDVVTAYEYVGTPAWRHTDDDGITRDDLRTWSDYRGYGAVLTRLGDPGSATRTLSKATFFRGMHGDRNGTGGTRTVTLPAVDGNGDGDTSDAGDAPAVADQDAFAGMVRQTTVYNGVESAPVSTTINEPWQSAPTASRDMGQTTAHARYTAIRTTWAARPLAAGGWRVSRTDSAVDSYGMLTQVDDWGDVAATGDETCTRTTYQRNTGSNLLTPVARVQEYALRCGTAPTSEADVISDTRTSFDGLAYGATPTRGDVTRTEVAKAWSAGGGPVWLTGSTAAYDPYGRPVDVADVRGNHTTTAYTPASGGPVTATAVTTPLGTTTATVEPSWGRTTAVLDMNNKRTEGTFDALGRTREVWLASRPKASFPSEPNAAYTYLVRNTGGVNAVTSSRLNPASTAGTALYTTSHALFDGLLRPRQTQAPSAMVGAVGTVFSETKYDDQGRPVSQSQHYDSGEVPGTDLVTIADWQPRTQTVTGYDRAGRVTASVFRSSGVELWRTTTTFHGNRVDVVPPPGGTATTAITDAQGRTVEVRQYHDPAHVGSDTRSRYDAVTYSFDRRGRQDAVTDNAGNVWTYAYDLLGRPTGSHDPDKGTVSAAFNDAGDLVASTDAGGRTLAYTYDDLGRKTGTYAGQVAPANKLATWAYDPPGFKGQVASSSRWRDNGTAEYRIKVRSYTPLYQSTGEDYVIPATPEATGLSGTYTTSRTYRYDGSPATVTYPAAGGLGAETVTYTYDPVTGLPEQLLTNSGQAHYVSNTDYTAFGELAFLQYQLLSGSWVQRSFSYDDATRRLTGATTIRQNAPQPVNETRYDYDATGNITSIAATSDTGAVDTQCFDHDYARRLVDAWTPAGGDCAAARSATALGGPAPYWLSWTYDAVGNRASQTRHTSGGDTTTSYAYPAAGSARPHALASTTTGATTRTYGYDAAGNTTCRPDGTAGNDCPAGSGSQTLAWDAEDHLTSVTGGEGTSSYVYTADGVRLLADDPDRATLYLPGTDISRDKATGAVTATRYFSWGGQVSAMKTTGGAVTWLIGDHQGTQSVAVAAGDQAVSTRRQLPFGEPRGGTPSWPNPKGFVGGDLDPSGLVHIGAREYDPALGRFVSVDPVFDQGDPQSWTGYAYANNTPVTASDPTGLMLEGTGGGSRSGSGGSSGGSNGGSGCNYSNAYAQGYCQSSKKSGGTRVADTTRQRDMNACYNLALARQGCTHKMSSQQCFDSLRSGGNCRTSPTLQMAQYERRLEQEAQQRAAEAAREAERRAAEKPWWEKAWDRTIKISEGFSNFMDDWGWDILQIGLGIAAIVTPCTVVCGALAAMISVRSAVGHIQEGRYDLLVFDVVGMVGFGAGAAVARSAGAARWAAHGFSQGPAKRFSSPRKARTFTNQLHDKAMRVARAESWVPVMKFADKLLFGVGTLVTGAEKYDKITTR